MVARFIRAKRNSTRSETESGQVIVVAEWTPERKLQRQKEIVPLLLAVRLVASLMEILGV